MSPSRASCGVIQWSEVGWFNSLHLGQYILLHQNSTKLTGKGMKQKVGLSRR